MTTCPNCQATLSPDAHCCERCGRRISVSLPTPLLAVDDNNPIQAYAPASPASDGRSELPPPVIALRLAGGQQFRLSGKSAYTVGRRSASVRRLDVDLGPWANAGDGLSREHITIHVQRDGVYVEDMDSTNKTIHNGFRLMQQQWYRLHDGDELWLGKVVLRVLFLNA
ncbi:MAG TPA: FHA domain-containing protein [Ktedonobacterales bacterium]